MWTASNRQVEALGGVGLGGSYVFDANRVAQALQQNASQSESRNAAMNTKDHVEGLEGWFQPGNEHDLTKRPLVRIAGTYTFYTGRLTEAEIATLGRLLLRLPGARPDSMGFFSDSAGDSCFEASFEPSGITVEGQASPEQWAAWDTAFRAAVEEAELPRFPA